MGSFYHHFPYPFPPTQILSKEKLRKNFFNRMLFCNFAPDKAAASNPLWRIIYGKSNKNDGYVKQSGFRIV